MDNQFTTLTRSYHDNYLQYKLTGNPSYKNAYLSAQEGIDNIVSSLEGEVSSQNNEINNFYSSNTEEKIRNTRAEALQAEQNIVSQRDLVETAKMRGNTTLPNPPTTPDISGQLTYLIAGGVILAVLFFI